jgi:tRNA nucleotidyltransferase (CCA-adding enzyme)
MKRKFTNKELETSVRNFSEAQEKLNIKNVTEFMRWLRESSDHGINSFYKDNETKIKNQMKKAKGLEVKFTNPELFWIEDILDSRLYRYENNVIQAMKENDFNTAEHFIQRGRMVMRLCEKVFLMLQYSNFKRDEKKYKNVRRREHSYRKAKNEPYYNAHARKHFNEAVKEIKRRKKVNLKVVN